MDSSSSSSSLSHRRHASSPSSTASEDSDSPAPLPQRRLTLTIPPIRIKPLTSTNPHRPSEPQQSSGISGNAVVGQRVTPRIKLIARKSKPEPNFAVDTPIPGPSSLPLPPPKAPRPSKLKPLKEVLVRLLTQIKKKDDYAFFLSPVSQVPGYADIIANPMDFGTMTTKIEKGHYKTLDDFTADFRLVISNAQRFNSLDSLYYTEAARIEHYGLEQIARAAAQVIEFETDWTINTEAEREFESLTSLGVNNIDVISSNISSVNTGTNFKDVVGRRRSPSVASSGPGVAFAPEKSKRSRKKVPMVTESWEPGGRLPGASDGLGSFPPGSDMARLMIQLKLRGKVFRNKKERMRIEKAGVPYNADGSLAIALMERPFPQFGGLVPIKLSTPALTPVVITQGGHPQIFEETDKQPLTVENRNDAEVFDAAGPVALPVASISQIIGSSLPHAGSSQTTFSFKQVPQKRFRHWNIIRNSNSRSRTRDDERDDTPVKRRKYPDAVDYGTFASLLGTAAAEQAMTSVDFEANLGSNDKQKDCVRSTLHVPFGASRENDENDGGLALDAEEYIRKLVYGGTDGLAYVRSIYEFVQNYDCELQPGQGNSTISGAPLHDWVQNQVVKFLTLGNHLVLRSVSRALTSHEVPPELATQLARSKSDKSSVRSIVTELQRLSSEDSQIDIASLLKTPHELFAAENEWAGSSYKPQRVREKEEQGAVLSKAIAADFLPSVTQGPNKANARHHSEAEADFSQIVSQRESSPFFTAKETREIVEHALNSGADLLLELNRRARTGELSAPAPSDSVDAEDAEMRRARLNLLAIAKRAPLEKIKRLPADLVPAHIRHIVPTLPS